FRGRCPFFQRGSMGLEIRKQIRELIGILLSMELPTTPRSMEPSVTNSEQPHSAGKSDPSEDARGILEAAEMPETIGPYEIVRYLGKGGMGVVYEGVAKGEKSERRVAIKLLKSEYAESGLGERFWREVRVHSKFGHRNIALYYADGTADKRPYFV